MVNRPGRPLGCDQVVLMAVTVELGDYGVRSRDEPSAPAVEPMDLLLMHMHMLLAGMGWADDF